jgi:hypothetical protein
MAHDNFFAQHPRSTKLGLKPVTEHPGYDMEEVQKALGGSFSKFQAFMADKSVFVCGHRIAPHTYTDGDGRQITVDAEVHCVYASDLEKFLEGTHA